MTPDRDCPLCPRLVAVRNAGRLTHPDWHNAPVPAFGAVTARLLIVGLAPGLRGAGAGVEASSLFSIFIRRGGVLLEVIVRAR